MWIAIQYPYMIGSHLHVHETFRKHTLGVNPLFIIVISQDLDNPSLFIMKYNPWKTTIRFRNHPVFKTICNQSFRDYVFFGILGILEVITHRPLFYCSCLGVERNHSVNTILTRCDIAAIFNFDYFSRNILSEIIRKFIVQTH